MPIAEIELEVNNLSTLAGIFREHYLSLFNEAEMEEYFMLLASTGLVIKEPDKHRVQHYCGGHPYLLGALGYALVEEAGTLHTINVDKAYERVEEVFSRNYDSIIRHLKHDNCLEPLLAMLNGWPPQDPDKMVGMYRRGIVRLMSTNSYDVFSEHFKAYLHQYTQVNHLKHEGEQIISSARDISPLNPHHLTADQPLASLDSEPINSSPTLGETTLIERLRERELDVLRFVALGWSNNQIADSLIISANTVKTHITHIFAKLGASNRIEAIAKAKKHGVL